MLIPNTNQPIYPKLSLRDIYQSLIFAFLFQALFTQNWLMSEIFWIKWLKTYDCNGHLVEMSLQINFGLKRPFFKLKTNETIAKEGRKLPDIDL